MSALDLKEPVMTPDLKPIDNEVITSLALVKVVAGGVFGWSTCTFRTKAGKVISRTWSEPQSWIIAFEEHKVHVYNAFCREVI